MIVITGFEDTTYIRFIKHVLKQTRNLVYFNTYMCIKVSNIYILFKAYSKIYLCKSRLFP